MEICSKILIHLCLLNALIERNSVFASPKYSIKVEDNASQEQNAYLDKSRVFDAIPPTAQEISSIEDDLELKYRSKIEEKVLQIANGIASKGSISKGVRFDWKCQMCIWGAEVLLYHHRIGDREIFAVTTYLCKYFIAPKSVCSGMITDVGKQLFDILDMANGTVKAEDICAMALAGDCAKRSKRMNSWQLDIPDLDRKVLPSKPPIYPANVKIENQQKILHLSDVHLQLDYKIGSNAACSDPICCSSYHDLHVSAGVPFRSAGKLGDYQCDLPVWTYHSMLSNIKETHPDIDFIFITGDFPAHDSWRQNRSGNIESIYNVVQGIKDYFPNTPVFPAVGNHETFPVNMFPDPNFDGPDSIHWLYNTMSNLYLGWLPGWQQQQTIKDGGYYSISLRKGLRLISLNTNFCNNMNFWLLINFEDPHKHLHWLYNQLLKAEFRKEQVFIIGHIAPGLKDCLGQWSEEYARIIHRFRNIISAQFFGHTHFDEFEIFFGKNEFNERAPTNMAYLAPSMTTIEHLNPAYRIFMIDGDHNETTNLVLDHLTFFGNLTAMNKQVEGSNNTISSLNYTANMTLEYSAINDLQLEDMSPKSWWNYVKRLAKSQANLCDEKDTAAISNSPSVECHSNEFQKYYRRYVRYAPQEKCEIACKKEMLCNLVTSNSKEITPKSIECKEIERIVDQYHETKNKKGSAWWQKLIGKLF